MPKHTDKGVVAGNVATILEDRHISGRRLARELGCTSPYIARRLSGEVEFSESDIRMIAAHLRVSFDDLLTAPAVAPSSPEVDGSAAGVFSSATPMAAPPASVEQSADQMPKGARAA